MAMSFAEWQKKNSTTAKTAGGKASAAAPRQDKTDDSFAAWQAVNRPELLQRRQDAAQAQYERRAAAAQRQQQNPSYTVAGQTFSRSSAGYDAVRGLYDAENGRNATSADIDTALDGLRDARRQYDKNAYISDVIGANQTGAWWTTKSARGAAPTTHAYDADAERQRVALDVAISSLQQLSKDKKAEEKSAELQQRYGGITSAADYEENSRWSGSYDRNNATWSTSNPWGGYASAEDLTWAYINGDPHAREVEQMRRTTGLNTGGIADLIVGRATGNEYLEQMTKQERGTYNYLRNTQGVSAANAYLDEIKPYLTERNRKVDEERLVQMTQESPFSANAASVLVSPFTGAASLANNLSGLLSGQGIDQNAPGNFLSYGPQAIRNETDRMIREGESPFFNGISRGLTSLYYGPSIAYDSSGESIKRMQEATDYNAENPNKLGSFLYQTGMSTADFLYNAAVSGGNEAISLALLGTRAAADSMTQAKDAGMDDKRTIVLGLIAGAAEIITEKVSLEALLNPNMLTQSGLVYFLKNQLAEGSEEVGSDIINWLAEFIYDALSGQNEGDIRSAYMRYLSQYGDEKHAMQAVIGELASQAGLDFAGGFLSGGVMAGPVAISNNARYAALGAQARSDEKTNSMVEMGLSADTSTPAYGLAKKVQSATAQGASDTLLGKLQSAIELDQAQRSEATDIVLRALAEEMQNGRVSRQTRAALDENPYAMRAFNESTSAAQARATDNVESTDTVAEERTAEAQETPPAEAAPEAAKADTVNGYTFTVEHREDGQYVVRVTAANGNVMTESVYPDEATAREVSEGLKALVQERTAADTAETESAKQDEETGRRGQLRQYAQEKQIGENGLLGLLRNAPNNITVSVDEYAKEYAYYYDEGVRDATQNADAELNDLSGFYDVDAYRDAESAIPLKDREYIRQSAFQNGRRDVMQARSAAREAEQFSGAGMRSQDYRYVAENYGIDVADRVNAAAKKLGVEVRFVDLVAGGMANAEIRGIRFTEGDKVKINKNIVLVEKGNPNPLFRILGHEWMHRVQDLDAKAYRAFVDSIDKDELDKRIAGVKELYDKAGMEISPEGLRDEAVADYAGELLQDGELLDEWLDMHRDDRTLIQKLWDAIKSLFSRLDKQEQAQLEPARQKLLDALKAAEKAVAENPQAGVRVVGENESAATEGGMRYSTKKEVLALTGVDWMANDSSIKQQLEEHSDELKGMEPVAVVEFNGVRGSLIDAIMREVPRIGGKHIKRGSVTFDFNRQGAESIASHARSPEIQAAALAAPYVAKYGRLIAGQENHEGTGLTTLTYAAPVIINESSVNVGVVIQFEANGKPRAVNVGHQSGKPFRIDMKKAPKGLDSRVTRYNAKQGTSLPTMDAFENSKAQSGETVKRQSLKDMDVYNRTAVLKESTVDKYLADYAAKSSPSYAQAYIVRMSPADFVNLTTSRAGLQIIEQQTGDLNMNELQKANVQQPIQLRIDHETGEINGHEGRHRALALARAGVTSVPVLLFDSSNKNSKAAIDGLTLTGQDFGSSRSTATVTVNDVQPLSYANRDAVVEKFTKQPGAERVAENYGRQTARWSLKSDADYLAAVDRGDMETAQSMVDEAARNAGYNYIRYTRRKQSVRNNDADYYMFAENDGYGRDDLQSGYGQYGYYASDAGSIDVSDIIDDLREAWRGFAEANGYESSIDDGELNPDDIVMSAGAWDNRDFVAWLFEHGIIDYDTVSVKTYDGLIVFDSSLVKSADPVTYDDDDGKVIPLSERFNPENTDIRFSMKSPVEEKQNLIAMHNLTADKLGKALDLGGFPMPSIAVTKTDIPHTNFGDITLVMNRSTVDPQADRRNTVYSADAWTPTFPSIEYEADEKVATALRKRYYDMRSKYGDEATRPLYPWGNYANDELTRRGGVESVIDGYRDDPAMMKLYLMENGMDVPAPVIEETVSKLDDATAALYDHFINALGKDAFEELRSRDGESPMSARKRWWKAYGDRFNSVYKDYLLGLGFSDEEIENVLGNESVASQTRKAAQIRNYLRNGAETRTTRTNLTATNDAIRAAVDAEKYDAWLHGLFDGLEKSSGIYNGKDRYTQSGNQRSFSATHYAVTLENIAKAMAAENNGNSRNVDGFYGVKSLRAGTAKRFSSIAEMHDYEGRLQHLTEEEAKQITDALSDRMNEIMEKVYDMKRRSQNDNSFIEMDRIGNVLMEITEQKKITVDSVENVFSQYGYKIGNELAVDIRNLLFDVSQMPVNIFEAKPERAVRFDEVMTAVVPSGTDSGLVQRLKDAGVQSILEYENGNDADRMEKVNSVDGARFSLKSPDETSTAAQLLRENRRLEERVAYFKGQLVRTRNWTADEKSVSRLTRNLVNEFEARSQLDKEDMAQLNDDMRALVEYAHRGADEKAYEAKLRDMAYGIARTLIHNSRTLSEGSDVQMYREVRSRLRSPMTIDARYANDIAPDKWGEWRNANKGRVNVSINGKGIPVDTAYKELSEAYPWLFPESVTNPADQVRQMLEAIDTLEPVYVNPYSASLSAAIEYAANGVLDAVMDDSLQQKPTFADKKWEQIQQERKANWEFTQAAINLERAKRDKQIAALKEHYEEVQKRKAARAADSDARTRLLKIVKRLQNAKLPAVTRELLNQYIADIDTVAKGITPKGVDDLVALKEWYDYQKDNDPDFIADAATEKKLERLSKRQIANMTASEVAELTEVLLNIENEIANERRIIDSEDRRDTRMMVLESIYNVEETQGSKKNLTDLIADNTLSPLRLLRRLTGYVDADPLYQRTRELADGQRKMLDYQMRAERLFSKWANDTGFVDRIRRKERIKITGIENGNPVTVEITPDMRMALYLHSLNDQNMRHIAKGGVTIPDIDLYLKGDLKDAYARGRTIQLTPSNVRSICSKMSEAERAYARAAHDYFNGMSRDEVNATSEKLVGYSIAGVEDYFPIETDRNFTKSNIDELKRDGTIEGMGFLKERVNASNAINLVPLTDVLNRSIKNHAKYVGLAIPIRNYGKLWGMAAYNEQAGDARGLRQAIGRKWGIRGVEAVENMITDLQSAYKRSDDIDKLFGKIRSNYAAAVLVVNFTVAMKQAASYPTAAAVLGWKPLLQAMTKFGRVDLDLISKYTPLQWYRSNGYSTQELGDIKARQGIMDKVMSTSVNVNGRDVPLFNWIQSVDLLTTRKLWKASEYYVRDNNKELEIGSEEYYKAVADIYNRVIEETQPNYTTMQRPQLLRSQSAAAELLGMFKTQPFQNFNILYDAIGELRAAERMAKNGDDSKLNYAKKNAANAISSQIVQLAVFAAMTMAGGLLRGKDDKWRDKEGNITVTSILLGVAKDMVSGAFSMVPAGSDIYNVLEAAITGGRYYGSSSATMSAISDAGTAIVNAGQSVNSIAQKVIDGEEVSYKSVAKTMEDLVIDLSKAFGIPVENVRNDVQIVMRQTLRASCGKYLGEYAFIRLTENMDSSYVKGDVYDNLYRAYMNDRKAHKELYDMMVKDGFKPDNIKNAMEKRMKEAQGVKSVSDLTRRYSAP